MRARLKLRGYLAKLMPYVSVPIVRGADAVDASFELLKEQVEFLTKWWGANKQATYWDEKRQQLMAKGWTPEDYTAAIRKRQQQEREHFLNAPLTDTEVAVATEALVARMDRTWTEAVQTNKKSFGSDCGAKLEKNAQGGWSFAWKQSKEGPLYVFKIAGPKIEKLVGNREYPLRGTFTKEYYDDLFKKVVAEEEIFHYDKLRDKWVPGALPPR